MATVGLTATRAAVIVSCVIGATTLAAINNTTEVVYAVVTGLVAMGSNALGYVNGGKAILSGKSDS